MSCEKQALNYLFQEADGYSYLDYVYIHKKLRAKKAFFTSFRPTSIEKDNHSHFCSGQHSEIKRKHP